MHSRLEAPDGQIDILGSRHNVFEEIFPQIVLADLKEAVQDVILKELLKNYPIPVQENIRKQFFPIS